ncbi:MAG: GTP 3',8-cyclase MoaA [Armatimonadota bacterium]
MPEESKSIWKPLVDSYGRRHDYLRVSLTDRCNFRCQYCMPSDGIEWQDKAEILSFEEIEKLVRIFVRLGVRKVRLTGGEPTVRKGIVELVQSLGQIEGIERLLMTTNGTSLKKIVIPLKQAGLNGINISLDSLQRDRFQRITRRDAFDNVMVGIEASVVAGISTKINVVVMPGMNDDELIDFVEFVRNRPIQVRFIEFMPFGGNLWKPERVIGYAAMKEVLESQFVLNRLPGEISDVAKEFWIEGFQGTVGFVTSVTDSFCEGCNRIRMSADGRLKTCLFLPNQTSLRDMVRSNASDEDIANAIRADLSTKWAGHPPMNNWKQLDQLSMVQIGG